MEYLFNFDNTFEIHDDMEVLKKMKMTMGLENGTIDETGLRRARGMVPQALHTYVDELAKNGVNAYNSLLPKVQRSLKVSNDVEPDPCTRIFQFQILNTVDDFFFILFVL